jgi:oxygen-independent coproporphyrinogen-3 oxidase
MTPWGLYVHVPACRIRCPYCAFYVVPDRELPAARFVDRVIEEVARRRLPGDPRTIYVGGGTPSRLPLAELTRLLAAIVPHGAIEVTVEANPEDVDATWLAAVAAAGVDRVSLGVQTLDGQAARRLARVASATHAAAAAALLRASPIRTWSADLMFALPGQTAEALTRDLDALLALAPPHVSVYGLTVEPGTAFERASQRGRLPTPDDELWRWMYSAIIDRLSVAGLERYEVSNFARPGHASAHNRGYWDDLPYLGVGPSAHGYLPDGSRQVDVADLTAWLAGGEVTTTEPADPEQRALDALISGLRGVAGLPIERLARLGFALDPAVVASLTRAGLVATTADRIRLAPDGFFVADAVVRRLADSLRPALAEPDRIR